MPGFWHLFLANLWNAVRLLVALIMFLPFFDKRENYNYRAVGAMAIYVVIIAAISAFQSHYRDLSAGYVISYFGLSVYLFLFLVFCYKGTLLSYFFHFYSAAILASCVAAIRSCFLVAYKIDPVKYAFLAPDGPTDFIITVAIMAAIYSAMYCFFVKRFRLYRTVRHDRYLIILYLINAVLVPLIAQVENTVENLSLFKLTYIVLLIQALVGFTMLYIQYIVFMGKYYELQKEAASTEKAAVERISRETFELYNSLRENMDAINIKCHDIKHRLTAGFHSSEDNWTEELANSIDIYDRTIKTGNEQLDTVIMHHQLFFHNHSIRFYCVADGRMLSFMDLADIYTLFGNALSNAGEYLVTVPEENRLVRMWIKAVQSFLIIHVENYFNGELNLVDGLPQTAKDDKQNHGFGTKSMRLVAEKYGGTLDISVEYNMYCLNILIPLET